ncbi:MAG: DMT family transporter [Verrucomicrobiota bacterium]
MSLVLILLPLLAGFLYALSSLFLKKAFQDGVGLMRVLFVSNIMMGFMIIGLLPLEGEPIQWGNLHLPLIGGLFFFLGQVFTFVAIRVGDVSIVTPTMGTKVILVAVYGSLFFGRELSMMGWVAVVLAGGAVVLLGITPDSEGSRASVWKAIGWAFVSCSFFSMSDNLVSEWSPAFGRPAFLVITFLTVAVMSVVLIPFFSAPLRAIPVSAWKWLGLGGFLLAFQALLLGLALVVENPIVVNTIYSSRGLWAVILVVLIGSFFGNREGKLAKWVLAARASGSVLILVAIYLMLFVAGVD